MLKKGGWQFAFLQGTGNGFGGQSRCFRVCGMSLHNNRTTGGQSRGRIAANGRIGVGKVTGSEHNDRSERNHRFSQIGPGRISFGQGGIDADPHPVTLLASESIRLQLIDRTRAFDAQTPFRQVRLPMRSLNPRITHLFQFNRDGA